jgi:hypothetical protein
MKHLHTHTPPRYPPSQALHYKELEYHTSPSTVIEALISINNELGQPEAAMGILTFAQQNMARTHGGLQGSGSPGSPNGTGSGGLGGMGLGSPGMAQPGSGGCGGGGAPGPPAAAGPSGFTAAGGGVGKGLHIHIKESWYEKLQNWKAALHLYDAKLLKYHGIAPPGSNPSPQQGQGQGSADGDGGGAGRRSGGLTGLTGSAEDMAALTPERRRMSSSAVSGGGANGYFGSGPDVSPLPSFTGSPMQGLGMQGVGMGAGLDGLNGRVRTHSLSGSGSGSGLLSGNASQSSRVELSLGRMRCLEKLGDFEVLAQSARLLWDLILQAEQQNANYAGQHLDDTAVRYIHIKHTCGNAHAHAPMHIHQCTCTCSCTCIRARGE